MPILVVVVFAAAAAFVLWTSGQMPDQVASHFGVSGRADSFMSRSLFVAVMLAVVTVVPASIWLLQRNLARKKKSNIPNRDYWFGPQHQARTVRFLENHAAWFAIGFAVFMSAVHWMVVQANASSASMQLDTRLFLTVLGLFVAFTIGWVALLHVRFRR